MGRKSHFQACECAAWSRHSPPAYAIISPFSRGRLTCITKTSLFKYTKILLHVPEIENFQIFFFFFFFFFFSCFCSNHRFGYSLEPPRRDGSNKYQESKFLRNKENYVYPCKPKFYYIKRGLRGSALYRHTFVMGLDGFCCCKQLCVGVLFVTVCVRFFFFFSFFCYCNIFRLLWTIHVKYSRTSIARTPMARLSWLIRFHFWVLTKFFL